MYTVHFKKGDVKTATFAEFCQITNGIAKLADAIIIRT